MEQTSPSSRTCSRTRSRQGLDATGAVRAGARACRCVVCRCGARWAWACLGLRTAPRHKTLVSSCQRLR
eukprot:5420002-Prymnesium_polylepis.1